jgi:choline dehydrogenase-like flavoprotein
MSGPHRVADTTEIRCDALVVGSGAGGSAVADVLTRAGHDTVMVEEGGYFDSRQVPRSIPDGISRMWRCGGLTAALGTPPVAYVEGKCGGGGTEINSAIFQRTPGVLLDEWATKFRISEFGANALAPYYERAEKAVNASLIAPPLGASTDLLRRGGEGPEVASHDAGTCAKCLRRHQPLRHRMPDRRQTVDDGDANSSVNRARNAADRRLPGGPAAAPRLTHSWGRDHCDGLRWSAPSCIHLRRDRFPLRGRNPDTGPP